MGLFGWPARRAGSDAGTSIGGLDGLGIDLVALRLERGALAPDGAVLLAFDGAGRARRGPTSGASRATDEIVYCFHPGPYGVDLVPFAAAPELGLRLHFLIDEPDPRVERQRFELFLFSEAGPRLELADFGAALQAALQLELGQGNLELPPCTSAEEWNAFRAGLNQLLYTRFGITLEDCVPLDLGERIDFAAQLAARAAQLAPVAAAPVSAPAAPPLLPLAPALLHAAATVAPAARDAGALRRLFLELPAAGAALRGIALPPGQELFQNWRALLQRVDLINLAVGTMPALAWAAPGQPLALERQRRRAAHSAAAVGALDEAWALLARLQLARSAQFAAQLPALLDEADRILANLEHSLEQRRAAFAPPGDGPQPSIKPDLQDQRREPT